jgi:DNA-binding transcriptional regulator YiaG
MKKNKNKIPVPDFAAQMRVVREGLKLTRPEFANLLSISKHAVAAYEQRLRRVPADVWERTLYLQRAHK